MNNLELSIVLPTYNECENIKIFIPRIEDVFRNIRHEIIVVDDSSPDGTGRIALELNKTYGNIRLISRVKKEGIGAALRAGYNQSNGAVIFSSDADLSFSAEDMLKLFEHLRQGYDLVVGCRHSIQDSYYEMKKPITAIKGIISRSGNLILRILSGMNIHDFSANFRAIRNEIWKKLNIKENTNIMLFEMLIKAKYESMRIKEIPVSFCDRLYGKSKLNLCIEIPKYILKMMYYILKYR